MIISLFFYFRWAAVVVEVDTEEELLQLSLREDHLEREKDTPSKITLV